MINILPMQEQHIEGLASIERACFHAPWSADALREELGKGLFLVAQDETGVPVGYVGCQTVLDEGYITNVAVDPAHRRQGVARTLLTELETRARAQNLAFVTLEVRASNAPAIALYTAAGYEPVGRRKNFYRAPTEDALLMTLTLRRA
nr:ribosomal protein S18-alanine N-acetyltransferase [uncultured Butyricicoccus sp.]